MDEGWVEDSFELGYFVVGGGRLGEKGEFNWSPRISGTVAGKGRKELDLTWGDEVEKIGVMSC